jgi:CHC2 zinc finger
MFRRDLLPDVRTFYEQRLGKLSRPDRKGNVTANPPCHRSKSGKSFIVNIRTGGYRCWGCQIHGGDVIDFTRWQDGCSFKEACQRLGCWEQDGEVAKPKPQPKVEKKYLVMDFELDGTHHRAEILDEPKDELEWLRRIYMSAADRLLELHRGDQERFEGEAETEWSIMADSWQLIQWEQEEEERKERHG